MTMKKSFKSNKKLKEIAADVKSAKQIITQTSEQYSKITLQ